MMKVLLVLMASFTCNVSAAQGICPNPIYDAPVAVQAMIGTDSELVVAGYSPASDSYRVATYDGTTWTTLPGDFNDDILSLAQTSKGLVVGGEFNDVGGLPAVRIARFQSGAWTRLGSGIDSAGKVLAIQEHGADLYCGGVFTSAGGAPALNIAKWSGAGWQSLGSGVNDQVRALASYGGLLVAGGDFTVADGAALPHVAGWDGVSFTAPGLGSVPPVFDLEVSGGQLFAAATGIYEVTLGIWRQVGKLNLETSIHAKKLTFDNGEPVALGEWITFCITFGYDPCVAAARFSGGTWNTFLVDDMQATPYNLGLAAFGGSVYLQGASPAGSTNLFYEYAPHAVIGSLSPKSANWYESTNLTLNVGCLDTSLPGSITIGGSAPFPAIVTSASTLSATVPPGAIPEHGYSAVVFEQGGETSVLPGGFQVLPYLSISHVQLFSNEIRFSVDSGSGVGTSWFFTGVTTPPHPFAVPGIHGLVEMPLAQVILLGTGSLGAAPALTVPYDPNMVPKGIPIRFQALVGEDVGSATLWSITNSQFVEFSSLFLL